MKDKIFKIYPLTITVLGLLLWFIGLQILIFAVMASRIILGVHYFTDVFAGYASGIMVCCASMIAYHFCERNNILTEGFFAFLKRVDKD